MNMREELQKKYEKLQNILRGYGSVAVAFSSGVDSTLLLKVAHDVLGGKCIALTGKSVTFPERERNEADEFCKKEGIQQFELETHELEVESFSHNPKNRCYLCKHELFSKFLAFAKEKGMAEVVEGSNMDDLGDYRPGLMATAELGVKSPLRDAGLNKQDIRDISQFLGLPTWKKQSFACLSSRFVYGEEITVPKLSMVDQAEQLLMDLGFTQLRVRIHGESMARIEVPVAELQKVLDARDTIIKEFKNYGFTYVTMDLEGFRSGSMNASIDTKTEMDNILAKAEELRRKAGSK